MRFDEAYKLVNFDRLSSSKTAAARQAVVNQVKGQSHLSNAPGLNASDNLEDIPASMLENFKDRFPEKSVKELKALYNKVLKTQKG
jgi:nitrate/TMAO reductase-like tetraheme cytochrome c subunit